MQPPKAIIASLIKEDGTPFSAGEISEATGQLDVLTTEERIAFRNTNAKAIAEHPAPKMLIVSGPGTGKSYLFLDKIRVWLDAHRDDDEPNVRVPTRLMLYNLTNILRTLSLTIANVKITSISAHSAVVSWKTNIDCSSLIERGQSAAYDFEVSDQTLVQTHSILLSGLLPSTVYHYSVVATASSDQTSTTKDTTFTTAPGP